MDHLAAEPDDAGNVRLAHVPFLVKQGRQLLFDCRAKDAAIQQARASGAGVAHREQNLRKARAFPGKDGSPPRRKGNVLDIRSVQAIRDTRQLRRVALMGGIPLEQKMKPQAVAHILIRQAQLDLVGEAPENGGIEKMRVIGRADCHHIVRQGIQPLKDGIDDPLQLAQLVPIIPYIGNGVHLVEK